MGRELKARSQPLTRERIITAALALIDEAGLDALSMRQLGRRLGVDPMAIYHHIENKEQLLQAVVRKVLTQLSVPPATGTWQQRVTQWAEGYRAIARAHPNLVLRIVSEPTIVAAAAVHVNEVLYAALEASGLPPGEVVLGADLIVDYVNGVVLAEATGATQDPTSAAAFEAELASRPPEQVAVQRRLLAQTGYAGRDSFQFGLDTILTGLAHRPPAEPSTTT